MKLSLDSFKELFHGAYKQLVNGSYFDEAFGYWCVDAERVPGTVGSDAESYALLRFRRSCLWPVEAWLDSYTEDDTFDVIEFLFDHVSAPVEGNYHSYNDCGMHWHTFDRTKGQADFREVLNPLLAMYGAGFKINDGGEIIETGPKNLKSLLEASLPKTGEDVEDKVQKAVDRFRRHRSSIDERRNAVRDLADVLEFLRPKIKIALLKKDESDLFSLANNFGIRHHNSNQKTDYDQAVWLSWMFYYYLATIHACLHLIERQKQT